MLHSSSMILNDKERRNWIKNCFETTIDCRSQNLFINYRFCQPTEGAEAESAGGRGPLHVAHCVHVGHMFTTRCLP